MSSSAGWPRRTTSGVIGLVALASCTVALAQPVATAAPQPQPVPVAPSLTSDRQATATVQPTTTQLQATAVSGAAPGASQGSWYNTVRYNRLYKYGGPVGVSKCKEPAYPLNSLTNIRAYHEQFLSCLNKAWQINLAKAKITYRRPQLVLYQSTIATKCGVITGQAYFCGYGNGQIFIPWTAYMRWYKQNPFWARTFIAQTMAHEYGHHIQYLSGILSASWNRQRYTFKTTESKLAENRRRELQATCLGGAYLGADRNYFPMRGQFYTQWRWTVYHMGDQPGYPRDHGSYANNGFWATRGYTYHTSGTCIPWATTSKYWS